MTSAAHDSRQATGVPGLDEHLGGGLVPGTLTVVVGATGIGKTLLGLHFAQAGQQESRRGVLLDLSSRGDSQSHAAYAQRLFNWSLDCADGRPFRPEEFYTQTSYGDYLHAFEYSGRRVTRHDLEFDAWQQWQEEVNRRLQLAIAFLYGNFVAGSRRLVVDGIEPVDRPQDSIQFYLFDYLYHQVVRKDPEWVARDLFRQNYLRFAAEAAGRTYAPDRVGCLLLVTSHSSLLDDLLARPLDEGDVVSNANTLIYMGKVRSGTRFRRGLYIAKHRGSACSDELLFYRVTDRGLEVGPLD